MENNVTKIVCAVLIAVAAVVVVLTMRIRGDRTAPEIQFAEADFVYDMSEDDSSKLLQGVTAFDRKDGDVSRTLVVESVVPRNDGETAVVSYVASDSSNNVVKVYRTVKLLKKPTYPPGENPDGSDVQFPDEVR